MTTTETTKMKEIVRNFKNKRILVLGDFMLDKFIWGQVSRISPEAPVPVVEVQKETMCLGGAGNVCRNLESLGAYPLSVGVVGNDLEGEWIKSHVSNNSGIFIEKNRPTTVKTRIIAHQQQVVRVDQEKKKPLSPRMKEQILDFIQHEKYDGMIISDYNKGILSKSLMNEVHSYVQKRKIPVYVDPKVKNISFFSSATLITPNHKEAEQIAHHPCDTDSQVEAASKKILSSISVKYLIIKRGEQGMSAFEREKRAVHIPTITKQIYDVSGAGDTVIATAALALLCKASIRQAAIIANSAAGIVVGKIGTATLTSKELLSTL